MAWRLAKSLVTLRAEVLQLYPGTTFWTIGDQDHASGWSDHNPNSKGVVCAADLKGNAGLNLRAFSRAIVRTDPPALKYVIFNRQIWHPGYDWQPYYGENPHKDHVHVSVGWGPDGRSTGNYDDTSPWGITEGDNDMQLDDRADLPGFAQKKWPTAGTNGAVLVESALTGSYAYGRLTYEEQARYAREAKLRDEAILAAVKGDESAAILEAISRRAEEDARRDAELLELVTNTAGVAAERVVEMIRDRLAAEV